MYAFLKKSMFALILGCLVNQLLVANIIGNQGIQFYNGSWDGLLSMARSQNKPIFVEMSASWCMPCKKMQQYVFTEPDIGDFYNSNFINYIVDIDTEEGKKIKKRFNISSIPDLFYLKPNGEILVRETGMKNKDEMFSFAQRAIDRMQPVVARSGKKGTSRLYDKVYTLKNNNLPYERVVNRYLFNQWWSGRLKKQHNMNIVYEFSEDLNTKAIDYLLRHKKAFGLKYGEQAVDTKIKSIVLSNVSMAAANKNGDVFKKVKKVIRRADLPDGKNFSHNIDMVYYEGINDKEQYVKIIKKYMRKYKEDDATVWHQKAWAILGKSKKRKDLKLAKKWIEKSVELGEQYYNLESLATVYAKLGRNRKASKAARKAIRTARKTGRTPSKAMNILSQNN